MRDYKSAGTGSQPGLSSRHATPTPRRTLLVVAAALLLVLGIAAALLLRGPDGTPAQAPTAPLAASDSNAIPLTLPPPTAVSPGGQPEPNRQ
jgi:hypothetical protein